MDPFTYPSLSLLSKLLFKWNIKASSVIKWLFKSLEKAVELERNGFKSPVYGTYSEFAKILSWKNSIDKKNAKPLHKKVKRWIRNPGQGYHWSNKYFNSDITIDGPLSINLTKLLFLE